MDKKPVYIASPYAGDVPKNIAFAIRCCRTAIQQGETPLAPHLLYPQMLNDDDPKERSIGLFLGARLLAVCKEVWVCGDRISLGMEGEIARARELDIPIRYMSEEEITAGSNDNFELNCHNFASPKRMIEIANNAIDSFGELLNGRSLYDALAGSLKMSDEEILAAGFTTLKEFMGSSGGEES